MKTLFLAIAAISLVHAQGRSQAEWMTAGADMQRSHSIPTDPKISVAAFGQPGFQFLWKTKLGDDALGPAILMDRYIGFRGFRSFAFFASASGTFAAVDSDLNRVEWKRPVSANIGSCGPTSAISRTTFPAFPSPIVPGRTAFARSDVGSEGLGAVTLPASLRAATAVLPPRGPSPKPRPAFIYTIAADGKLHSLYIGNGEQPDPSIDFLPPQSSPQGFVIVNNDLAYASTAACNGARAEVWALDIATRQVSHWKPERGEIAGSGGPAFAPDGTAYAATSAGEIFALAPHTLDVKEVHSSSARFIASPVVFPFRGRSLIAVSAGDGAIHLIDAANLAATAMKSSPAPDIAPTTLTTWETVGGVRWIVASGANAIAAWKIVEREGAFSLERAWTSRELASPSTPMTVNGVVFALSGTTLYAFDGAIGKKLWDSGTTLASSVRSGSLSGGAGQIYLSTNDGTVYAFGYPMEH